MAGGGWVVGFGIGVLVLSRRQGVFAVRDHTPYSLLPRLGSTMPHSQPRPVP